MNATLIGDVGATGSDWILIRQGEKEVFSCGGFNPVSQSFQRLDNLLEDLVRHIGSLSVDVYYYGAGIGIGSDLESMQARFAEVLNIGEMEFASDLLGAARALCGDDPGVVCILGTGSNACYYNGSVLTGGHSLGYPLGDEGSGMDIGRRLVKDFYYGLMPSALYTHLNQFLPSNRLDFLQHYKSQLAPNQYLASLTRHLLGFENQTYVQKIVSDAFTDFIKYHLYDVERTEKINAVGSIAFYFCGDFEKCLRVHDLEMGKILQKPIEALAFYHSPNN
ncbi:MAG: hypothetical protein KDC80_11150 [Saprospiraceae bacterium]|nr:hypothetical protein [Saprospiraceae bacterium]